MKANNHLVLAVAVVCAIIFSTLVRVKSGKVDNKATHRQHPLVQSVSFASGSFVTISGNTITLCYTDGEGGSVQFCESGILIKHEDTEE